MWGMLAWEGYHEAEAALVSAGTAIPLSPSKSNIPRLLGYLSVFFWTHPLHPQPNEWVGNQPTY